MSNEMKNDPAKKMRNLLGGSGNSPITRLPQKDEPQKSFPSQKDGTMKDLPALRTDDPSRTIQAPSRQPSSSTTRRLNFGPPFWTVASLISLTVNIMLMIALIVLLNNLDRFDTGNVMTMGNNLLGGLYTNFEKMDRANIATSVQVNTTIPVKFELQLNQQTNVVLSQDVTIDNAVVTVKTGGLNIANALTTIVLPQGTILPVVLNLTVPVDASVPVTLDVPVDIPLNQTQLHEPFVGLQAVIKPFYCMINTAAVNLDGQPVCK